MNALAPGFEEARGLRKRHRPRLSRGLARAARRGSDPNTFVEKVAVSPPRRRQEEGKGKGKNNGAITPPPAAAAPTPGAPPPPPPGAPPPPPPTSSQTTSTSSSTTSSSSSSTLTTSTSTSSTVSTTSSSSTTSSTTSLPPPVVSTSTSLSATIAPSPVTLPPTLSPPPSLPGSGASTSPFQGSSTVPPVIVTSSRTTLSAGAIAGITVGATSFVVILLAAICFCSQRVRRKLLTPVTSRWTWSSSLAPTNARNTPRTSVAPTARRRPSTDTQRDLTSDAASIQRRRSQDSAVGVGASGGQGIGVAVTEARPKLISPPPAAPFYEDNESIPPLPRDSIATTTTTNPGNGPFTTSFGRASWRSTWRSWRYTRGTVASNPEQGQQQQQQMPPVPGPTTALYGNPVVLRDSMATTTTTHPTNGPYTTSFGRASWRTTWRSWRTSVPPARPAGHDRRLTTATDASQLERGRVVSDPPAAAVAAAPVVAPRQRDEEAELEKGGGGGDIGVSGGRVNSMMPTPLDDDFMWDEKLMSGEGGSGPGSSAGNSSRLSLWEPPGPPPTQLAPRPGPAAHPERE